MTCFFDPSHAPGSMNVTWSPQWGVPRPVMACPACAQRVQTTPPPFYLPQGGAAPAGYPQPGYPAPSGYPQPGYPQPGYPAQPGYPQPGYAQPGYPAPGYAQPHQPPQQKSGHGTGALIGAGLAGLAGGALIGSMMEDDHPSAPSYPSTPGYASTGGQGEDFFDEVGEVIEEGFDGAVGAVEGGFDAVSGFVEETASDLFDF